VAQGVDYLPKNQEALSTNPSTDKKKKKNSGSYYYKLSLETRVKYEFQSEDRCPHEIPKLLSRVGCLLK
jgi:hypothetical protein